MALQRKEHNFRETCLLAGWRTIYCMILTNSAVTCHKAFCWAEILRLVTGHRRVCLTFFWCDNMAKSLFSWTFCAARHWALLYCISVEKVRWNSNSSAPRTHCQHSTCFWTLPASLRRVAGCIAVNSLVTSSFFRGCESPICCFLTVFCHCEWNWCAWNLQVVMYKSVPKGILVWLSLILPHLSTEGLAWLQMAIHSNQNYM